MALVNNENNYLRIVAVSYDFRADYFVITYEIWENEQHRLKGASKFHVPLVQSIPITPERKVNDIIRAAYLELKKHIDFKDWEDKI